MQAYAWCIACLATFAMHCTSFSQTMKTRPVMRQRVRSGRVPDARNREKENQRKRKYTGCQNCCFLKYSKIQRFFTLLEQKLQKTVFLRGEEVRSAPWRGPARAACKATLDRVENSFSTLTRLRHGFEAKSSPKRNPGSLFCELKTILSALLEADITFCA